MEQQDRCTRGVRRSRKKSYYKGFPIEHKPNSFYFTPLHAPDRRKKVKDCGTTNGHMLPWLPLAGCVR
ncbi:hypothetical protein IPC443_31230 [Pseudomonas aeruginosa]|nr:hypothetical protein IPC443_31230 [Pseudomonas aeruginosa]